MLTSFHNTKPNFLKSKIIEQILPSNLPTTSKQHIAILLKNDPKISSKIMRLKSLIYTQLQVGTVMFVNALIGLIPVPIIPGLIRTANKWLIITKREQNVLLTTYLFM